MQTKFIAVSISNHFTSQFALGIILIKNFKGLL
jgi:hypothetical protein